MEPITDHDALIQRISAIFQTMTFPGLSGRIRELSYAAGTVTIEFEVARSLANPFGAIQGGVVAILLDACIGIAGTVKSGATLAMPLAEMKTSFVRPVLPGIAIGTGETIRLGKNLAFIEGTLLNESGNVLARASGTACPTPWPSAQF
jgi:uncharacterized protein (TIGR00369 family)